MRGVSAVPPLPRLPHAQEHHTQRRSHPRFPVHNPTRVSINANCVQWWIVCSMDMGCIYSQVAMKTNDVWRRHRRITAPIVSSKYLNQLAPVIDHNTRLLVSRLTIHVSVFFRLTSLCDLFKVEYWEKKIEVVKREGGTCFACASDFQNSALVREQSNLVLGNIVLT